MKKIIIILFTILLIGCSKEKIEVINEEPVILETTEKEDKEEYTDNNPIIVSLYENYSEGMSKITEQSSTWQSKQDILIVSSIFTDQDIVYGYYFQDIWNDYYQQYENIDTYKIGYYISFKLKDGTVLEKTILKPSDDTSLKNYISVYLYDDINQEKGAWYRHVEDDEVKENTMFTSIKITAEKDIDEVTSPISLTTFTYQEDDLDEFGNYKGNSKYTILIYNN